MKILPYILTLLFSFTTFNFIYSQITFNKTSHNFGIIKESENKIYETTFTINNNSSKPKAIMRITSTCGCTTAEYDKSPIISGESRNITVLFNPIGQKGKFRKTISILFTEETKPHTIYIEGEVIPNTNLKYEGYRYNIGPVQLRTIYSSLKTINGKSLVKSIPIINSEDNTISIYVHSDIKGIKINNEKIELKPGEKGNIEMLLQATGNKSTNIKLVQSLIKDNKVHIKVVKR